MTDNQTKSEAKYCTPACLLIHLRPAGILCESKEGKNESFDSWDSYDNDGWH